jgi:large subunit ribosomal protein L10e
MGKRLARNYRHIQLPYTRKEYIKRMQDVPEGFKHSVFGNSSKLDFPAKISLVAERDGQVSAKALVSVRVTIHREMRVIGEENYRLKISSYPHHQARSHGLVGVAKAERISSGMGKQSFGAAEMRLAQIKKGRPLIEITMNDDAVAYGIAKKVLDRIMCKLPLKWQIKTEGLSLTTLLAKVNLPKRIKEKKGKTGGQQVAELNRELK